MRFCSFGSLARDGGWSYLKRSYLLGMSDGSRHEAVDVGRALQAWGSALTVFLPQICAPDVCGFAAECYRIEWSLWFLGNRRRFFGCI